MTSLAERDQEFLTQLVESLNRINAQEPDVKSQINDVVELIDQYSRNRLKPPVSGASVLKDVRDMTVEELIEEDRRLDDLWNAPRQR